MEIRYTPMDADCEACNESVEFTFEFNGTTHYYCSDCVTAAQTLVCQCELLQNDLRNILDGIDAGILENVCQAVVKWFEVLINNHG